MLVLNLRALSSADCLRVCSTGEWDTADLGEPPRLRRSAGGGSNHRPGARRWDSKLLLRLESAMVALPSAQ